MRLTGLLAGIAILGTASSVGADIYVWHDAVGVGHYTNDLANVPPEFRDEAQTVARDWVRAEPPAEIPLPAASDPVPPLSAAWGDVYEAGYHDGFRAGAQAPPAPASASASSAGSVVHTVWIESVPLRVTERWVPVPLLVE